ncbi:alpha-ketoglutarate-dependent dioxygenase AlkB family protein [Trichothermofontia sp.]
MQPFPPLEPDSLFAPPSQLTQMAIPDGKLSLYAPCLPAAAADRAFNCLLAKTPWRQESITLFGKRYQQPRLIAWYGDTGKTYRYSGLLLHPLPWTETLISLKTQVEALAAAPFNSVLLNYYRDGQDSMGWHSDDEPELGVNPVIASLSLGASRRFCLRHRSRSDAKVKLWLSHGSLLIMAGATQHYWQHAVPKTAKAIGPRLNLTFRWVQTTTS